MSVRQDLRLLQHPDLKPCFILYKNLESASQLTLACCVRQHRWCRLSVFLNIFAIVDQLSSLFLKLWAVVTINWLINKRGHFSFTKEMQTFKKNSADPYLLFCPIKGQKDSDFTFFCLCSPAVHLFISWSKDTLESYIVTNCSLLHWYQAQTQTSHVIRGRVEREKEKERERERERERA